MPNYLTLLDIAKMNGSDRLAGVIEDEATIAPEVQLLPSRTIDGTSYKTLFRESMPRPGFRAANSGTTILRSQYRNKLVETYYFDGQMEMDIAVARADEQGEQHALDLEEMGMAEGALKSLGAQLYYGRNAANTVVPNASVGFFGAVEVYDTALEVDAGGTTANTGSSVYALKLGAQYCSFVFGLGDVLQMGEWRIQRLLDASSNPYDAYINALQGYVGVQFLDKRSVGRIKKLTEDSGKGLTDSLLADLIGKYPANFRPDVLMMTPRSVTQLQKSRTATLFGSAKTRPDQPNVAPRPTEYDGIPIIETDSILNTESLSL